MTDNTKLTLEKTHKDRVIHIVLSSPENLNAMDLEMAAAFRDITDELRGQDNYRAIVIRGQGRAFSAGGDLEMLKLKASNPLEQNRLEMMAFYLSFLGLRELDIPLVCALHGHVVGAGFCFSAACDLRIGDESCLLSAPFTRLALYPGMGGSYFLPRAFGSELARELMLTGRRMTGREASARGYLRLVEQPETLGLGLERLLDDLLKSAPLASKALIRSQRQSEADKLHLALQAEALEQAECYARSEFLDGIEALQKKQSPAWAQNS